jgi:hypothetical protein
MGLLVHSAPIQQSKSGFGASTASVWGSGAVRTVAQFLTTYDDMTTFYHVTDLGGHRLALQPAQTAQLARRPTANQPRSQRLWAGQLGAVVLVVASPPLVAGRLGIPVR